MTDNTVNSFVERFLKAPRGDSPEQIEARVRHWTDIANHPAAFVREDANRKSVSERRNTALRNLGRLLAKYPQAANPITDEQEQ